MIGRGLSTKGRLLVATPPLGDPNFDRSVVYMIEHNDDGAIGVVLNRPSSETSVPGLDDWFALVTPPAVMYHGGPVELDALIAIGRGERLDDEAWSAFSGSLGTIDLELEPQETGGHLTALRIFRGYSGWSAGQLEGELSLGAWIVIDSDRDDVFSPDPAALWRTVLRRQGGRLAWIANAPDDLSSN